MSELEENHCDLILNQNEQKGSSFWKVVKSFITNKGHHNGSDLTLLEDGRIITDHGEVAEVMNNYYINVAAHIGNKTIKQDGFVDHPSIKAGEVEVNF